MDLPTNLTPQALSSPLNTPDVPLDRNEFEGFVPGGDSTVLHFDVEEVVRISPADQQSDTIVTVIDLGDLPRDVEKVYKTVGVAETTDFFLMDQLSVDRLHFVAPVKNIPNVRARGRPQLRLIGSWCVLFFKAKVNFPIYNGLIDIGQSNSFEPDEVNMEATLSKKQQPQHPARPTKPAPPRHNPSK
jgi:hypothetical protein